METVTKKINVAASVLAGLSLGIYRSPANALKELVSNAFDADATRIIINTGYPYFEDMVCQDDGQGMSSEDFQEIMTRIGGSAKRDQGQQFTRGGRPIIGRIGIGILAVAQICKRFTVVSSQRGASSKFEAIVDFSGFAREEAKKVTLGSLKAEELEIGSYELAEGLPEEKDAQYTRLILHDIESGFRERLLEDAGPESKLLGYQLRRKNPRAFREFVKWLASSRTSIRRLPDYLGLFWELAVVCPVRYFDDGPIPGHAKVIPRVRQQLIDFDFTLVVDGLELRKPVLLPTSDEIVTEDLDYQIYPVEFDEIVAGERLAFSGYLFHQRLSIVPPELRGLLVRVRNVAIGMYDKSFLNYPTAQGPRMASLTGEICVTSGLESALNVDRNSFRETDPHYLKLQEVVFTRLGGDKEKKTTGVFSDVVRRSEKHSKMRSDQEDESTQSELLDILKSTLGHDFAYESGGESSDIPIQVDVAEGTIVIDERHQLLPRSKSSRRLMKKVLVAYELANHISKSKDQVHREFYRLLTEMSQ